MADSRLTAWETLFQRALTLIDSVGKAGITLENWSFGGGTVLMLRHMHRYSKDIDIFIPDPQYLAFLSPRVNSTAELMTGDYVEQANYIKLQFKEGEIDFVVSGPLTENPTRQERMFDRDVLVETSTEIVAKKLWHRGANFKARDIFDLAMVVEREPDALAPLQPVLRDRRDAVFGIVAAGDALLRRDFAELDVLEYRRSLRRVRCDREGSARKRLTQAKVKLLSRNIGCCSVFHVIHVVKTHNRPYAPVA